MSRPSAGTPLPGDLLERFGALHDAIREACLAPRLDDAEPRTFRGGDTLYAIDTRIEPVLLEWARDLAARQPFVLVAEGLEGSAETEAGQLVVPEGTATEEAAYWVIVDPIDGTRGLMYDKRSAWCLTAAAPARGQPPMMSDLAVAMQSEIPTRKQSAYDVLWAVRGGRLQAERRTLDGRPPRPLALQPSRVAGLEHGFAMVTSFFPGTKREAAELIEFVVEHAARGRAGFSPVFDDQYISTAGQLYEMIAGHDRFNADLRPLFFRLRGEEPGLSCHPYDLCCALLAEAAGVQLTDGLGRPLDGPLDVETPMSWLGYANVEVRRLVEPLVFEWLARRGLSPAARG